MKSPRGIRNNNPANIRRGSAWKGLVPFLVDSTNNQRYYDKSFCQFESMEYGIRALFVLLRTYSYKYKLNTISKIIHRFAPLSENNTYAYISNVLRWMSEMYNANLMNLPDSLKHEHSIFFLDADFVLSLFRNPKSPSFACRCLAKAICLQECGFELTDEMIDKSVSLL